MGYLINKFVAELFWKMEYRAAVRQSNKVQRREVVLKREEISLPHVRAVALRNKY